MKIKWLEKLRNITALVNKMGNTTNSMGSNKMGDAKMGGNRIGNNAEVNTKKAPDGAF